MRWLIQWIAVSAMSLRSLHRRLDSSLVAIVGFAGVVLVVVAVLSIRSGFQATLADTGSPDVAIVLHGGTGTEVDSILGGDNTHVIAQAPGVAARGGRPMISPELLVQLELRKRGTGTEADVSFRGVTPEAFRVHDKVRIVAGRMFTPGLDEIIVGADAARNFRGLRPGEVLRSGSYHWRVVGVFDDGGGLHNSEIWTSLPVLQAAYRRGDSISSVYTRLATPGAFAAFKAALTGNPQLSVSVQRESHYFAGQARDMALFIGIVGGVIAALMGGGAVFGAVNTMYTAVAARTREIATLRALGFGPAVVLLSVLAEAMSLATIGGACGGALAYALFNGFEATTYNQFSVVAFRFAVTPHLLLVGMAYALVMGLAGGLLPAVRAARMPVAAGLRAV